MHNKKTKHKNKCVIVLSKRNVVFLNKIENHYSIRLSIKRMAYHINSNDFLNFIENKLKQNQKNNNIWLKRTNLRQ
jgi:hypothetical protein